MGCCIRSGRIRDIFSSVRQAGSFKRWSMQSHYEILTLRGLANRDYITSTDPKLNKLVALPNEVLCHVLGYWENTSSRLSDLNPSFRARRVRKKQKARGTSRA